jgi:long-chain acyl-CoA synthetase
MRPRTLRRRAHGARAWRADGQPARDGQRARAGRSKQPVAALVYTTGTTGKPKGVMLSHRNLLFVAAVSSRLRGLLPADLAYGVLPISHVYGLTSVLLGTLYAGACLRLEARFTPRAMLDAIRGGGLTIVQGVPAMYARLLELCALDGVRPPLASALRFAYAGGSPLDPLLKREVESLLGVPLHNGYGLTEAAPTVSQTRLDAPRVDTSVGFAIPGVEVRVEAPDGQLFVRGPNVMQGYYRDPAGTAAVLSEDGWLATGDLARRDRGRRLVHSWAQQGADHPLRLQGLSAGSRDGAERAPGGDAVGGGRPRPAGRQRGGRGLRPAACRQRVFSRRARRLGRRPAGAL